MSKLAATQTLVLWWLSTEGVKKPRAAHWARVSLARVQMRSYVTVVLAFSPNLAAKKGSTKRSARVLHPFDN
jgi:hypothetical protein